jgi:hypothetical protein
LAVTDSEARNIELMRPSATRRADIESEEGALFGIPLAAAEDGEGRSDQTLRISHGAKD